MGTMMLYAIYDKVAETMAGFAFEMQNDGAAIRSMRKQVVEDKEDFELVRLGSIDHKTLVLKCDDNPHIINWIPKKEEEN